MLMQIVTQKFTLSPKWASIFQFSVAIAAIVLGTTPLVAQKYSNEFLAIGVGARAHGMAGAQVAHANDLTAAYWNPAGLTNIEDPMQVAAMHAEWFAGVAQYDYLGFAKALNRERGSVLAFSLIRLGIDNIPYTINLVNSDGTINYGNLSSFSAADYAFIGSYAQHLHNPEFSVGGNVKIIRRVIGKIGSAWGFGSDLGLQWKHGHWMAGIQARDLTTTFNAWSFTLTEKEKQVFTSTGNEIPKSNSEITKPRFIFGGGYRTDLSSKMSLLAAADLEMTTDGERNVLVHSKAFNIDPRIGFELDYRHLVQLRLGAGNFQRVTDDFDLTQKRLVLQPNFGIGLRLGRIQLDYALTDIGNVSQVQYSHIFSLRLDLKERRKS